MTDDEQQRAGRETPDDYTPPSSVTSEYDERIQQVEEGFTMEITAQRGTGTDDRDSFKIRSKRATRAGVFEDMQAGLEELERKVQEVGAITRDDDDDGEGDA